ncbi:MAG TPA: S9 family peptidase, partial [Flavobacterium alvei]|nr:S9 family peptidase [Flavobacterium alvei]
MKKIVFITLIMMNLNAMAQNTMSPEMLLKLGRISALGLSKDGKNIIYKVDTPSAEENKSNSKLYSLPINGGNPIEIASAKEVLNDKNISPDGKFIVYDQEVKIDKVHGKDFYPELDKSNVQIYNGLDYRHWDKWNEGKFNHVFYKENKEGADGIDILKGENFDSPQKPF